MHSFEVCGEAQDGKEAIAKVVELKPDIVLLDINMPVMDGITAAAEIRRLAPATKIVFLTLHDTAALREHTRPLADGFVAKNAAGDELVSLLERLSRIEEQPEAKPPAKPGKRTALA